MRMVIAKIIGKFASWFATYINLPIPQILLDPIIISLITEIFIPKPTESIIATFRYGNDKGINTLNIDLNDICDISLHNIDKSKTVNPFNSNLLYLYYISKGGIVISSIEITETKNTNYILMKNGLNSKGYKQEYTGVLESNYNTAFICLTNAANNPGLDKFQVEIDLHSKIDNKYYGIFLGISDNTHKPTARKCILTNKLITSKEKLYNIFEELKITKEDLQDMIDTKYWDMKTKKIKDYVIKI